MHTYSSGVGPADLCLELCEAHEQNYVVLPLVAHVSRREVRCIRCGGDVGLDVAQRFELVFGALSAFYKV